MAIRPSARGLRGLTIAVGALAAGGAGGAFVVGRTTAGAGSTVGTTVVTAPLRALDADQAEVRGTVTRVVGTQVAGPVLPVPLTLNVVRGGGTKATVTGGTVGGKPLIVLWDGGRPLPLTGTGRLDFAGPADVEVTSAGATWALDGATRALLHGTYGFGATVAVGAVGLASPQDGVTLVVPGTASVTTKGGVTATEPRGDVSLAGPGSLLIEGELTVRTTKGTSRAGSIRFGPGAFELSLSPRADGGRYTITKSLLQGAVTVGG